MRYRLLALGLCCLPIALSAQQVDSLPLTTLLRGKVRSDPLHWIEGRLVSCDSANIILTRKYRPAERDTLSRAHLTRLEYFQFVGDSTRRHGTRALRGLGVGALVGVGLIVSLIRSAPQEGDGLSKAVLAVVATPPILLGSMAGGAAIGAVIPGPPAGRWVSLSPTHSLGERH
jgi:hypothetical protein